MFWTWGKKIKQLFEELDVVHEESENLSADVNSAFEEIAALNETISNLAASIPNMKSGKADNIPVNKDYQQNKGQAKKKYYNKKKN